MQEEEEEEEEDYFEEEEDKEEQQPTKRKRGSPRKGQVVKKQTKLRRGPQKTENEYRCVF